MSNAKRTLLMYSHIRHRQKFINNFIKNLYPSIIHKTDRFQHLATV